MTCKPYIFVHDDEYYAYCARCRWVSDTATNITVARVRAPTATNKKGRTNDTPYTP